MNRSFLSAWAAFAALLLIAGCTGGEKVGQEPEPVPGVVNVTIETMNFRMPDTIPSGWTTFRLDNRSAMTHLAVVEKMPEGYGIVEQQAVAAPIFQDGMNLIVEGNMDGAMAKFGELPEWFHRIVFLGGPGLVGPGKTTEASVYLEPGNYLLECYVKTDGIFHSYNPNPEMFGMVAAFTVTAEASGAPEPSPTLTVNLSGETGMEIVGSPTAGEHVVAVHFIDQKVHENFAGHDVHVVRLTPETDMDALVSWMNWAEPAGLQTPAPAEFLGGTNEMPAGGTAYFRVDLAPGEYAFIAEVPAADEKGLLQRFAVK